MVIIVQLSDVLVLYLALERIETPLVQCGDRDLRGWYNLLAKVCHAGIALLVLLGGVEKQTEDLFRHFLLLHPFQILLNFDRGHRWGRFTRRIRR